MALVMNRVKKGLETREFLINTPDETGHRVRRSVKMNFNDLLKYANASMGKRIRKDLYKFVEHIDADDMYQELSIVVNNLFYAYDINKGFLFESLLQRSLFNRSNGLWYKYKLNRPNRIRTESLYSTGSSGDEINHENTYFRMEENDASPEKAEFETQESLQTLCDQFDKVCRTDADRVHFGKAQALLHLIGMGYSQWEITQMLVSLNGTNQETVALLDNEFVEHVQTGYRFRLLDKTSKKKFYELTEDGRVSLHEGKYVVPLNSLKPSNPHSIEENLDALPHLELLRDVQSVGELLCRTRRRLECLKEGLVSGVVEENSLAEMVPPPELPEEMFTFSVLKLV